MRRKAAQPTLLFLLLSILLFFVISTLRLSRTPAFYSAEIQILLFNLSALRKHPSSYNHLLEDDLGAGLRQPLCCPSVRGPIGLKSLSVLLPAWEVLVVVPPEINHVAIDSADNFYCLFPNNQTSPAKFVKVLPFSKATTFKCTLPKSNRRRMPHHQPALTRSEEIKTRPAVSPPTELLHWNFLVYESFSTPHDVVLFVKGVNNRQGVNRSPDEFKCVFDDGGNRTVKTAVTSSVQEVFRCNHPNLTMVSSLSWIPPVRASLEISSRSLVIPSVAYYHATHHSVTGPEVKSLLCACTMIYNAGKFLREWVIYHSKIGVEKFILYDNGGDDETERVIDELNRQGYNIETIFWVWPKTQEAGFSHSVVYAKDSCSWVMYVDVDEFVFSTKWLDSPVPSTDMLRSLLPGQPERVITNTTTIGQVTIKCNDFGPSGQREHPAEGVTQGYTCRRRVEQRHKSIVFLEAVEDSLANVIHHFTVNHSLYETKEIGVREAMMNHYKYQAWPEFKKKFRRRVSAYVVDWTMTNNPKSKDRAPGLGFEAVEPEGWAHKFCEVKDERLKFLTQRWFAFRSPTSYRLAWQ